jgi:hypothetical protein
VPRPNPTSAAATEWGAGQAAARALIRSALESAQGPG